MKNYIKNVLFIIAIATCVPAQKIEANNNGILIGSFAALGIGGYCYYTYLCYDLLKKELFNAIECADAISIRRVLAKGIAANITNSEGTATITYALQHRANQEIIEMLLDAGAHVSCDDWNLTGNMQIRRILKDRYWYQVWGFRLKASCVGLGIAALGLVGVYYQG